MLRVRHVCRLSEGYSQSRRRRRPVKVSSRSRVQVYAAFEDPVRFRRLRADSLKTKAHLVSGVIISVDAFQTEPRAALIKRNAPKGISTAIGRCVGDSSPR